MQVDIFADRYVLICMYVCICVCMYIYSHVYPAAQYIYVCMIYACVYLFINMCIDIHI